MQRLSAIQWLIWFVVSDSLINLTSCQRFNDWSEPLSTIVIYWSIRPVVNDCFEQVSAICWLIWPVVSDSLIDPTRCQRFKDCFHRSSAIQRLIQDTVRAMGIYSCGLWGRLRDCLSGCGPCQPHRRGTNVATNMTLTATDAPGRRLPCAENLRSVGNSTTHLEPRIGETREQIGPC
jgi:hypothetical protein